MNRILSITRNVIPYVRELNCVTGGVVASILMQQLDYWFERYPKGFYKFLEPSPNNRYYSDGDSWTEELGISIKEFKTAFKAIGQQWKSKSQYLNSEDPFQGKLYCSYYDRPSNRTFYFRNHALVDSVLTAIANGENAAETLASHVNAERAFTVNAQRAFLETPKGHLPIYTETNIRNYSPETTRKVSDKTERKVANAPDANFPNFEDLDIHEQDDHQDPVKENQPTTNGDDPNNLEIPFRFSPKKEKPRLEANKRGYCQIPKQCPEWRKIGAIALRSVQWELWLEFCSHELNSDFWWDGVSVRISDKLVDDAIEAEYFEKHLPATKMCDVWAIAPEEFNDRFHAWFDYWFAEHERSPLSLPDSVGVWLHNQGKIQLHADVAS